MCISFLCPTFTQLKTYRSGRITLTRWQLLENFFYFYLSPQAPQRLSVLGGPVPRAFSSSVLGMCLWLLNIFAGMLWGRRKLPFWLVQCWYQVRAGITMPSDALEILSRKERCVSWTVGLWPSCAVQWNKYNNFADHIQYLGFFAILYLERSLTGCQSIQLFFYIWQYISSHET